MRPDIDCERDGTSTNSPAMNLAVKNRYSSRGICAGWQQHATTLRANREPLRLSFSEAMLFDQGRRRKLRLASRFTAHCCTYGDISWRGRRPRWWSTRKTSANYARETAAIEIIVRRLRRRWPYGIQG
jgi:hypothetical protein